MFEIKHLKTLVCLAKAGNLRKAAEALFTSQSALSHQIKDLERRLNAKLFIRNTCPVQFTSQGLVLLRLANDILPHIDKSLAALKGETDSPTQLNLAIACHACFQWLLPVTEQFSQQQPQVNIAFLEQTFTEENQTSSADQIDLLFTDEKRDKQGFTYQALGEFEVVAVFAKQQHLPRTAFVNAVDMRQHTLLTYPIKADRLDIFKLFLNTEANAKKYQPKAIKQVANSHMILQMVSANMGMAALPNWLVNSLVAQSLVQTKRIGEQGIFKTLYVRYLTQSKHLDIIEQLIPKTVAAFKDLNRNLPSQ